MSIMRGCSMLWSVAETFSWLAFIGNWGSVTEKVSLYTNMCKVGMILTRHAHKGRVQKPTGKKSAERGGNYFIFWSVQIFSWPLKCWDISGQFPGIRPRAKSRRRLTVISATQLQLRLKLWLKRKVWNSSPEMQFVCWSAETRSKTRDQRWKWHRYCVQWI